MHPLDGPCLKVCVAHDHFKQFWSDTCALNSASNQRAVVETDSETGDRFIYIEVLKSVDPRWSVRIGEFAHDLRSALDNLVWQLVLLNGNVPNTRNEYPIFLRRTTKRRHKPPRKGYLHYFNKEGLTDIAGVSPQHRDFIEQTQPYKRRNGLPAKLHPLWLLHELNNADKHRMIQLTNAIHSLDELELSCRGGRVEIQPGKGGPFKHRAFTGRFKFLDPDSEVKVGTHTNIKVVFQRGAVLQSMDALAVLQQTYSFVREILLIASNEFSHPTPPVSMPDIAEDLDPPAPPPEDWNRSATKGWLH